MNIEVKNSEKPVDYNESMKILEKRVDDVSEGRRKELLWILEHNTTYTAGSSSIESDLIDKSIKIIKIFSQQCSLFIKKNTSFKKLI